MGDLVPRPGDRALSFRQPWAILVAAGFKPTENRTRPWPSTVPAGTRIWVHASASHNGNEFRRALIHARTWAAWDGEPDEPANTMAWIHGWWANRDAGYGAIVGSALYTGCHHADECGGQCPWGERHVWHWRFEDAHSLARPVPATGRLGLWKVTEAVDAHA